MYAEWWSASSVKLPSLLNETLLPPAVGHEPQKSSVSISLCRSQGFSSPQSLRQAPCSGTVHTVETKRNDWLVEGKHVKHKQPPHKSTTEKPIHYPSHHP